MSAPAPAGIARRVGAAVADLVLLVAYWNAAGLGWEALPLAAPGVEEAVLLVLGIPLLAVAGFWLAWGATPGKRLADCRVVTDSGRPLDAGTVVARLLGYIVTGVTLGLGLLWAVRNPERRALHDTLAGTRVVMEDESATSLAQLMEEAR